MLNIDVQGEMLVFDLEANAFLQHMVRNLVGALVHVGNGRQKPDWVADVLASRDRSKGAPTFDAAGLYLVGVEYGQKWMLPSAGRMMPPFLAVSA